MAIITTTQHLDPATRPHEDSNPGRASNGKGKTWAEDTLHGDLKLPSGKKISETPTEELRTALHALGIEGAHSDGRNVIVARFAALIANFRERAGNDAVTAFLQAQANK